MYTLGLKGVFLVFQYEQGERKTAADMVGPLVSGNKNKDSGYKDLT